VVDVTDQETAACSTRPGLRGWLPIAGLLMVAAVLVVGVPLLTRPGPSDPTPAASDPIAWIANIAGQLGCEGPVTTIGGEVPTDDGVGQPGVTPEAALAEFLGPDNPYAALPAAGYTLLHGAPHWASFAHIVDGAPKAIIVLTDSSKFQRAGTGWIVIGLRACDPAEFDPNVPLTFPVMFWTDASGARVSTATIRSFAGPAHCGWASVTFLRFDGQTYLRDPEGVMGAFVTSAFEVGVQLPETATDAGYRQGASRLWVDPGADGYVVLDDDIVERWPRSTEPMLACT